jgi:hypothetical protein
MQRSDNTDALQSARVLLEVSSTDYSQYQLTVLDSELVITVSGAGFEL